MAGTFEYSNPTRISYGLGCLSELPDLVDRLGGRRPLLVSTAPVVENPSLMALLEENLPSPVVGIATIGGHAPLREVEAALSQRTALAADLVISLGGGGPIDAAKAVARGELAAAARVGAASQSGQTDFTPAGLPHIAVPTTLAAAELSWRAGFSNAVGDKVGFADRAMLPVQVFYEPRLAVFTPVNLWFATGIRAIDHAVEGFLSPGDHPFSDVLALEAIARMIGALRATAVDPGDLLARSEAQLAAWFSYTLPLSSMTGLSHQMGKQIGARHGIGHGETSALLLPHVMRYRAERDPERSAVLDAALNRIDGRGLTAAERVAELVADLGLPRQIASFGVAAQDLRRAAEEIATADYPADDLSAIYLAAL